MGEAARPGFAERAWGIEEYHCVQKQPSTQAEFEELFTATALRGGANRTDALGWAVLQADKLIDALDAKDAKEKVGTTPPLKPGTVSISINDLTLAKQAELRAAGINTFNIEFGGAKVLRSDGDNRFPVVISTNTTAPTWAEHTRPRTGTFQWGSTPIGPGWVQVGSDPVPATAPVPQPMASPSCPPGGCPPQPTRTLTWFLWVRRKDRSSRIGCAMVESRGVFVEWRDRLRDESYAKGIQLVVTRFY